MKKDSKVVRESIQNAQFDRLVRHHKDSVYRQLYRMCGNHDDAEDALAETLLKAYNALEGLQNEEALSAWLVQIARRTCGRMKKREQLRPVLTFAALGYEDSEFAGTGPSPAEELLENGCIRCRLGFSTVVTVTVAQSSSEIQHVTSSCKKRAGFGAEAIRSDRLVGPWRRRDCDPGR